VDAKIFVENLLKLSKDFDQLVQKDIFNQFYNSVTDSEKELIRKFLSKFYSKVFLEDLLLNRKLQFYDETSEFTRMHSGKLSGKF
jgi:hypothetical protein